MKNRKNVSKEELKNSLLISLKYNNKALDYIENDLRRAKDFLKYKEDDKETQEIVDILEYIKFSLTYLDNQYNESLKKVGVRLGSCK